MRKGVTKKPKGRKEEVHHIQALGFTSKWMTREEAETLIIRRKGTKTTEITN
jgi:hypothetical protein